MKLKQWVRGMLFSALACCLATTTFAQDEEENVQGDVEMTIVGAEGPGGPMIFSTTESFGDGETRSGMRIMSGSPGAGGMMFMNSMAGDMVMPAPDPWGMLNNPSVQKDLELVGDQLDQVQAMQSDFAKQMREQIGDITKGGLSKDRLKELPELMKTIRARQKEQLEGLLLPHQIKRLQQVALQTHLKQAGTAGALTSSKIAEQLGLTEKQQKRLKERSKEINEQMAKDMAELKENAKKELLEELTAKQREMLEEMVGDKYEPQTKDWNERFDRMRRGSRSRSSDSDSSSSRSSQSSRSFSRSSSRDN